MTEPNITASTQNNQFFIGGNAQHEQSDDSIAHQPAHSFSFPAGQDLVGDQAAQNFTFPTSQGFVGDQVAQNLNFSTGQDLVGDRPAENFNFLASQDLVGLQPVQNFSVHTGQDLGGIQLPQIANHLIPNYCGQGVAIKAAHDALIQAPQPSSRLPQPPRVRRPSNAWILYRRDKSKALSTSNPGLKAAQICKSTPTHPNALHSSSHCLPLLDMWLT